MSFDLPSRGSVLVLGGARSGKSAFGEKLVYESGCAPYYIATAQVYDDEMARRVSDHKLRRDHRWKTIEEPLALADVVQSETRADRAILVDCLTLWVTNLMVADADIEQSFAALAGALDTVSGPVVFVSNEVGLGIVPDNAMARAFRDHAGRLNQQIALASKSVYFIAAGLPMTLKG